jgi:predicted transcriptional regulator
MPVEKFSVSLPQELTRQLDELAEATGASRSSLVREATARYVASRAAAAESDRRSASVSTALAGFDEVAAVWGDDGRQGVEYLADIRDLDGEPGESEGSSCE